MIETIFDGLLHLLRIVFGDVLWDTVLPGLGHLGRLVLLVLTFGRYPRGAAVKRDENRLALVGVLVLVALWSAIAIHNNLGPG